MKLLSEIFPNPDNPRLIRDKSFRELKQSIKNSPWMMKLRPIVVDEHGMILGGDKRYHALLDNGYKEVQDDWVVNAEDLTEEQKNEFIIKDNLHAGDWNWETLTNKWDPTALTDWGLQIPDWDAEGNQQLPIDDEVGDLGKTTTRNTAGSDGYAVFEQLMLVDDKKLLLTTLNRVKEENKLDLLGDALMVIIRAYNDIKSSPSNQ